MVNINDKRKVNVDNVYNKNNWNKESDKRM
jgi:hypothetical protein